MAWVRCSVLVVALLAALARCAIGVRNAGARYGTRRLVRTQKCVVAVTKCVQRHPDDAECLARAARGCDEERAAFAADEAMLAGAIGKACGAVAAADLRAALGLGFAGEDAPCVAEGAGVPATVAVMAACVQRGYACRTDELVAFESPRAAELLALAGQDLEAFPCIASGVDGGGAGVGDAVRARTLARCGKAMHGAAAKFVRGKMKAVGKCLRAIEDCLYADGGATGTCLDGARAACAKAIGALTRPVTGVETKSTATIASACARASFPDLLAPTGLGYGALVPTCAALGVSAVEGSAALGACVVRQHECRVEQWLERATPRLRELVELGGTPLP